MTILLLAASLLSLGTSSPLKIKLSVYKYDEANSDPRVHPDLLFNYSQVEMDQNPHRYTQQRYKIALQRTSQGVAVCMDPRSSHVFVVSLDLEAVPFHALILFTIDHRGELKPYAPLYRRLVTPGSILPMQEGDVIRLGSTTLRVHQVELGVGQRVIKSEGSSGLVAGPRGEGEGLRCEICLEEGLAFGQPSHEQGPSVLEPVPEGYPTAPALPPPTAIGWACGCTNRLYHPRCLSTWRSAARQGLSFSDFLRTCEVCKTQYSYYIQDEPCCGMGTPRVAGPFIVFENITPGAGETRILLASFAHEREAAAIVGGGTADAMGLPGQMEIAGIYLGTYSRIGLYYEAMGTYSRIGLSRSYRNLQSY
jgi:hypothetical protein